MAQRSLAIVMLVMALLGVADGWRLQEGERGQMLFDDIGPDRYLIALGVLLAALAMWLLLQRPQEVPSGAADDTAYADTKADVAGRLAALPSHVLAVFALVAYAAALPWIGYVGSTLLFTIVMFRIAGVASWLRSAVFGGIATGLAYAIFVKATDVPLPTGWLMRFLG